MPYLRHPARAAALLSAAALLAVAAALPTPAHAQIRRCTTSDGGTVYTDRSCDSLGAVESRPPADGGSGAPAALRYRGGCARRLPELVSEVTAAIDARDTNRLARSYHWPGTSTRSGYALIERLDAIVRRPLLNITALRPARTVVAPVESSSWSTGGSLAAPPPPRAEPEPPRRPVALRIDQALADGITPSSTTFGLRRHMDCWWITL
ncbi:hypothetical protein WCE41_00885 [Luteimonas sp. MJ246]|uniref:hypothetical protein n=1 Tax=Luteimonas sp. MJ174 TaxID=3129237 RepID=UPI0031B9DABE